MVGRKQQEQQIATKIEYRQQWQEMVTKMLDRQQSLTTEGNQNKGRRKLSLKFIGISFNFIIFNKNSQA